MMDIKKVIEKLRESIIFETAWLFKTTEATDEEKEPTIEAVKVVWNRSVSRAGFNRDSNDLTISEDDIKEVAENWKSS
jgi:hypothetical protein